MTIALERGRTDVADRVVERLAARAVTEVAGVGGSAHRVLGVAVGDQEAVQVTARVTGDRAELDVRLSVVYPESVAATTSRVRAHLVARTEELTGLVVSKVDITVTELRTATARHRRVE
ncbi:Asp23/Gls24 family envelope stress response protein [Umezawaea tangerina]|uniref:Putative alkaline shock family protein YloU n=1 Tax=Umezawaea tangerina TaxID=84725 RepID=A0A2T0SWV6_9PSEU|nr:Asp23/Gls24 family envelope stress response protein [Umezawaea tangerina]PRY37901.1 putative alkaline shock family protein YloU [Umezawaea tangerina]